MSWSGIEIPKDISNWIKSYKIDCDNCGDSDVTIDEYIYDIEGQRGNRSNKHILIEIECGECGEYIKLKVTPEDIIWQSLREFYNNNNGEWW